LKSVFAQKTSFSLYQTRQTQESDVDPGVKNQLSAIKVLTELFTDFNLTHHQYNARKKDTPGEFFVKNYGLTILVYLLTLGLFALILKAPWLIFFSVLAHLIGIHFFVKNKILLFILSLVYVLLAAIAVKLDLELNALSFTLSIGLLLCSYLLQKLSRNTFSHTAAITFFFLLMLFLYFNVHRNLKESLISPAIFSLLILGLCLVIEKRLGTIARVLALALFSLAFASLLFFGMVQSFWALPILILACLQAVLLVVIGSEKSVVRILVGFPLLGAIL
jgi:hypothetical protein